MQVIGVPDDRMGEEVCAWIRLEENETATVEEIKEFCKDKVSTSQHSPLLCTGAALETRLVPAETKIYPQSFVPGTSNESYYFLYWSWFHSNYNLFSGFSCLI